MSEFVTKFHFETYIGSHRKISALLEGLVLCLYCSRLLNVISKTDRWTNGKPRFKYVCLDYRKRTVT